MLRKPIPITVIQRRCSLIFSSVCAWILLLWMPLALQTQASSARTLSLPDYETRKSQLLAAAAQPFIDDPLRDVETALDTYPYDQINHLACPKPVNNPNGWSIEMRTGGRPFLDFNTIEVNGAAWVLERCTQGSSLIPPETITQHYQAGKAVNRMWFTHPAGNGYPIVLVMTPDGFFNASGAKPPELQGAATRLGFIGEPFGANDYLQHVDEISITFLDDDTLLIVYSIHSEAGEGVLEFELRWDSINERPELHLRSAHATRTALPQAINELGFVGFNFMKGPTLSGVGNDQAFHDGRSLFLVNANGSVTRNLLISPVMTDTVVREDISVNVSPGSKIVLDQPQNISGYFSKYPTPGYEQRTDLILKYSSGSVGPVLLKRAQKSVNLEDINPEANETVNVFFATEMAKNEIYEFSYILAVASEDFESRYPARRSGVVYRSDQTASWQSLFFLPLDSMFTPAGSPVPLTDIVIRDPHHPSGSADGVSVIFDADDYGYSTRQRIYALDMSSGAVRRLTIDPFGLSSDDQPSLSGDNAQFSMLTDRHGTPTRLNIEDTSVGLSGGIGNQITYAYGADWCHIRNEIVYVDGTGLHIWDVVSGTSTPVLTGVYARKPRFSPNCEQIAYTNTEGISLVALDGNLANKNQRNTQLLSNADFPDWIDEDHLLFQREVEGNTDIYLLTISSATETRLTTDPASDSEPTYVKAVAPSIAIERPAAGSQVCKEVKVSGFVASEGIPSVTVNGTPATVEGDQWAVTLALNTGPMTLIAQVVDSATGLSDQDEISITSRGHCAFLPVIFNVYDHSIPPSQAAR